MEQLKIFIITGLSGSGKSTAIDALEDAGFYCVDNMPVALLPKFLQLPLHRDADMAGLAFVMDLREKNFLARYPPVLENLRRKGYDFEILFLEADEKILVQRYSQTRRQHPLSHDKGLLDGIRAEKEQLKDLKNAAHTVINTSQYTVHDLKAIIRDIAQKHRKLVSMKITVLSFGFKYGLPPDADLVIDVRFIGNPHFIPHLKPLHGEDPPVREYVLDQEIARGFLDRFLDLFDFLIPLYEKEGKVYLTLGVGCTGGRHRSVAISRRIYTHLQETGRRVELNHRDIDQGGR